MGTYYKDCPRCSGINKMGVTTKNGMELYHCFKCHFKGRTPVDAKYSDYTRNTGGSGNKRYEVPVEELEERLVSCDQVEPARLYLKSVHADSYPDSVRVKYDPKYKRVVFIYKDLYHGRSIMLGGDPKWYKYYTNRTPFLVAPRGKGVIVLVEDCPSAINCSKVYDSMAILGTNWPSEYESYLADYDRVLVALDEDATDKAAEMVKQINWYKPAELVILRRDLKYLHAPELELLLKHRCKEEVK